MFESEFALAQRTGGGAGRSKTMRPQNARVQNGKTRSSGPAVCPVFVDVLLAACTVNPITNVQSLPAVVAAGLVIDFGNKAGSIVAFSGENCLPSRLSEPVNYLHKPMAIS